MSWPDNALTRDGFLGGRIHAWQPKTGFRAGVDAVLLAASVPARAGQSVLELGCGVAVASLCVKHRLKDVTVVGVEKQSDYAALAQRNCDELGMDLEIVTADLTALPVDLRQRSFDHVMMNPPYFHRHAGTAAPDAGRDMARGEQTGLGDWIDVATRRLGPKGTLSLIQRIERLPDVLSCIDGRLGAVQVLPIHPRPGQPAGLFLLRACKGRRSPFRLCSPVVMHRGMRHGDTGDGYTDTIEATLRSGHPLDGFEN